MLWIKSYMPVIFVKLEKSMIISHTKLKKGDFHTTFADVSKIFQDYQKSFFWYYWSI